MALQLRRGTNAQRLAITPAQGELIYVTNSVAVDVSPLWVGDGTTVGGIAATADTLAGLNDVSITGTANNQQALTYNTSTSKWGNNLNLAVYGESSLPSANTNIINLYKSYTGAGTIDNGFGVGLQFNVEDTSGNYKMNAGELLIGTKDKTLGAESYYLSLEVTDGGTASQTALEVSMSDTKIAGNLTINYDQSAASSIIYAKTSGADSDLTWDGTNWTFADPIIAKTSLKLNGSTSNSITLSAGASPAVQTYTLPATYPASNGYILSSTTGGTLSWVVDANSGGDVVGPASATDSAVARFNLTTGKIIKNSGVIIDDSNNISGAVDVSATTLTLANITTQKVVQGTSTSTATQVITTTRPSMKVVIRLKDNVTSNVHVCEALLVAVDATTALITVYAEMYNSVSLATFTADVNAGNLRLIMTPASANNTTYSFLANDLGT